MEYKTFLKKQLDAIYRQIDTVIKDLSDDQFNWAPPGTGNPISAILLHLLGGEDMFIHKILQQKPLCWDAQEWSRRTDIPGLPGGGSGWEDFKTSRVSIAAVMEYGQAVRAETLAYLENLDEAELEREVDFFGKKAPAAEVWVILLFHGASHFGEIAAIKGIQGVKGLPF